MPLFGDRVPIESGEPILRARRTAGLTRVAMAVVGAALLLGWPTLSADRGAALAGFAMILTTALVQLAAPRMALLTVEESVAASAAILIVGFSDEHVNVIVLLWLVAIVAGVLARGGRVHWVGRTLVLCALIMPIVSTGGLSPDYAGLGVAVIAILLTSGRITQELNVLLRQARLQADSAQTLLLAGDIAARVSGSGEQRERAGPESEPEPEPKELSEDELANARVALARLIEGEGLSIAVQPIVEVGTGAVHAFEALARFGTGESSSPLHWLALAERLGARPALERACLREALALLGDRPDGVALTVNLSAPVLLEAHTFSMLLEAQHLDALVIEITEETLVQAGQLSRERLAPLYERGVKFAVDDMGAGYSGLRQITEITPAYLKLDRALCCGIDHDEDRAALVAALAGYARQVGSLLVAEGIETSAELLALRRIGVPLVQGFLLARPGAPWPAVDRVAARPLYARFGAETARRTAGPGETSSERSTAGHRTVAR
ncbi:MAG: EAL domain-containing protein [Solirubrobacteraceae bacterium]